MLINWQGLKGLSCKQQLAQAEIIRCCLRVHLEIEASSSFIQTSFVKILTTTFISDTTLIKNGSGVQAPRLSGREAKLNLFRAKWRLSMASQTGQKYSEIKITCRV